jgi:hypothetical protein
MYLMNHIGSEEKITTAYKCLIKQMGSKILVEKLVASLLEEMALVNTPESDKGHMKYIEVKTDESQVASLEKHFRQCITTKMKARIESTGLPIKVYTEPIFQDNQTSAYILFGKPSSEHTLLYGYNDTDVDITNKLKKLEKTGISMGELLLLYLFIKFDE